MEKRHSDALATAIVIKMALNAKTNVYVYELFFLKITQKINLLVGTLR